MAHYIIIIIKNKIQQKDQCITIRLFQSNTKTDKREQEKKKKKKRTHRHTKNTHRRDRIMLKQNTIIKILKKEEKEGHIYACTHIHIHTHTHGQTMKKYHDSQ